MDKLAFGGRHRAALLVCFELKADPNAFRTPPKTKRPPGGSGQALPGYSTGPEAKWVSE
jgi:hypothetical protein